MYYFLLCIIFFFKLYIILFRASVRTPERTAGIDEPLYIMHLDDVDDADE